MKMHGLAIPKPQLSQYPWGDSTRNFTGYVRPL